MVGESFERGSLTTGCRQFDGKRFFQYHGKWYDQKSKAESVGKRLKRDYGYEYHIIQHPTIKVTGGNKMNYDHSSRKPTTLVVGVCQIPCKKSAKERSYSRQYREGKGLPKKYLPVVNRLKKELNIR